MACNEESDREGSSRKRKLPAMAFARPYAAGGAQLRPTSRATLTAISVAIRGGKWRKDRVEEVLVGSSGALQGGPHNQPVDLTTAIEGLCFHCQEAHVRIHPGVCFNSRSTARRRQGTEPVFPQD
eukprot:361682-Chlamydomonas_euryale.AAC.4